MIKSEKYQLFEKSYSMTAPLEKKRGDNIPGSKFSSVVPKNLHLVGKLFQNTATVI
jgi:hypothetical protein